MAKTNADLTGKHPPEVQCAGGRAGGRAGLIDEPGGKRELLVGVDDKLSKLPSRSIPREDVAALSVKCLAMAAAKDRWALR